MRGQLKQKLSPSKIISAGRSAAVIPDSRGQRNSRLLGQLRWNEKDTGTMLVTNTVSLCIFARANVPTHDSPGQRPGTTGLGLQSPDGWLNRRIESPLPEGPELASVPGHF